MFLPLYKSNNNRYGSNYWVVLSPRLGRYVEGYSDLEYDHYILIESNSYADKFGEQAPKIFAIVDGKKTYSIFDMWVKWKNGELVFYEVKYEYELNPNHKNYERTMRQLKLQRIWCDNVSAKL